MRQFNSLYELETFCKEHNLRKMINCSYHYNSYINKYVLQYADSCQMKLEVPL